MKLFISYFENLSYLQVKFFTAFGNCAQHVSLLNWQYVNFAGVTFFMMYRSIERQGLLKTAFQQFLIIQLFSHSDFDFVEKNNDFPAYNTSLMIRLFLLYLNQIEPCYFERLFSTC
jgi:hypothetical protein